VVIRFRTLLLNHFSNSLSMLGALLPFLIQSLAAFHELGEITDTDNEETPLYIFGVSDGHPDPDKSGNPDSNTRSLLVEAIKVQGIRAHSLSHIILSMDHRCKKTLKKIKKLNKCVSKTHIRQTRVQLKLCAITRPPFSWKHLCCWLYAFI